MAQIRRANAEAMAQAAAALSIAGLPVPAAISEFLASASEGSSSTSMLDLTTSTGTPQLARSRGSSADAPVSRPASAGRQSNAAPNTDTAQTRTPALSDGADDRDGAAATHADIDEDTAAALQAQLDRLNMAAEGLRARRSKVEAEARQVAASLRDDLAVAAEKQGAETAQPPETPRDAPAAAAEDAARAGSGAPQALAAITSPSSPLASASPSTARGGRGRGRGPPLRSFAPYRSPAALRARGRGAARLGMGSPRRPSFGRDSGAGDGASEPGSAGGPDPLADGEGDEDEVDNDGAPDVQGLEGEEMDAESGQLDEGKSLGLDRPSGAGAVEATASRTLPVRVPAPIPAPSVTSESGARDGREDDPEDADAATPRTMRALASANEAPSVSLDDADMRPAFVVAVVPSPQRPIPQETPLPAPDAVDAEQEEAAPYTGLDAESSAPSPSPAVADLDSSELNVSAAQQLRDLDNEGGTVRVAGVAPADGAQGRRTSMAGLLPHLGNVVSAARLEDLRVRSRRSSAAAPGQ